MSRPIGFEQGKFGVRAVLTGAWSDSFVPILKEKGIVELELNDGKGWQGDNIKFVTHFPELKAFEIIDLRIKSVEPIHSLERLYKLEVITYCKTKLHFTKFPFLQESSLEWRNGAESIFDVVGLKQLFVNHYKGQDLRSFSRLVNLTSLSILGAPVTTLAGIESLTKLQNLRLGDLRRLQSLSGVEKLTALEKLDVNTCRKIGRINEVASLSNLRELFLVNDGPIASLKPIDSISSLQSVIFFESTNIVDGDLSPLTRQEHLSRVAFKNRRHYSHRCEDFWQYFAL